MVPPKATIPIKSEAMKVGVVGVARVGTACASAVALGFEKENAFAIIKALEKEAGVEVKARAGSNQRV